MIILRRHKITSPIGASIIPKERLPKEILTPDHVRDVLIHFTGTFLMQTKPNRDGGLWLTLTNEDPKLRDAFSKAEVYILNRLQCDMVFSFIYDSKVNELPDKICTLEDLHKTMYHFVGGNYDVVKEPSGDDDIYYFVKPMNNASKNKFKDAMEYVMKHKSISINIYFASTPY